MEERSRSGEAIFDLKVPYKIIDTGEKEHKPLIVYLHGFNQNISVFQQKMEPLLAIDAWHLFVQGPYPVYDRSRKKKVQEWGRAWYLYDGDQAQFVHSLEQSSRFLDQLLDSIIHGHDISASRTAVIGYSMGGYLGGYFGLSRSGDINDLVVIGSRIKTEIFQDEEKSYSHLKVLALHGKHDKSVQPRPQKKSCEILSAWGANVSFQELDEGHGLTEPYLTATRKWFLEAGYE